jgi:hypothetical protein
MKISVDGSFLDSLLQKSTNFTEIENKTFQLAKFL